MTSELARRIYEHKSKQSEGFTSDYNCTLLVYYEQFEDIEPAIKREKQIKNWRRQWKINLFQVVNPEWDDLSGSIF